MELLEVNFPWRPKNSEFAASKAKVGVAVVPESEVTSDGESKRQAAMIHVYLRKNCSENIKREDE